MADYVPSIANFVVTNYKTKSFIGRINFWLIKIISCKRRLVFLTTLVHISYFTLVHIINF